MYFSKHGSVKSLWRPLLIAPAGTEEAVSEKEFGRLVCGSSRVRVAGRSIIFYEPPQSGEALIERGMLRVLPLVTVPSTVGPLPLDKRLGEQFDSWIVCETESAADCESVSLL